MKSSTSIWAFLLLWSPLSIYGNDSLIQRIGVIGKVPVVIESAHTVYRLLSDTTFEVAPGRLRISVLPRGQKFNFDHLLYLNEQEPLSLGISNRFQFFYSFDHSPYKSWSKSMVTDKNGSQSLVDTVLAVGNQFYLGWRSPISEGIHTYLCFKVVETAPEIIGFRLHNFYDSSKGPGQLEKKILHRFNDKTGYFELESNSLQIPPGFIPEFRIRGYDLLTGEVISYRLIDENNHSFAEWRKSDHVLALPNLIGDKIYRLELRFPGQKKISSYILHVGLYWYEKIWVRVLGITLLIAIAVWFTAWFYRRRLVREQDSRARMEEQLRTLQSRLNPHFIFNALSSIEGLVSSGQNRDANHYLSLFSDILRQTLEHSGELTISLSEDLALLDRYIRLEQLRFGFKYSISVDPAIDSTTLDVPPMLMQPLLENAVKHGVSFKGADGEIKVTISASQLDIRAVIQDNGSRHSTVTGVKTVGGHGLRFTKERLAQYAKLHPLQPIEFTMRQDKSGTRAELLYRNLLA